MKQTCLKRNWLWSVFLAAVVISPARAQPQALTLEDCLRLGRDCCLNPPYTYNSQNVNTPNSFSFVALNGVREYLAVDDANWSMDLSGRLRRGCRLSNQDSDPAPRQGHPLLD